MVTGAEVVTGENTVPVTGVAEVAEVAEVALPVPVVIGGDVVPPKESKQRIRKQLEG